MQWEGSRLSDTCLEYSTLLASASRSITDGCDCMLLSGGVDTSFIAYSVHSLGYAGGLKAITVDLGGSDVNHARIVASNLGLKHIIVRPGREEFIDALRKAVAILATLDPVEASAGAVHVLSSQTAVDAGCRCLVSGDGGDELFLGYSFLHRLPPGEMRRWIKSMTERAWMPTTYIAGYYGLESRMPLYSWAAKSIALRVPLECMVGEREGRVYGKLLLRLYLEKAGAPDSIAWRPKAPVTGGSGSLDLLEEIAREAAEPGLAGRLGLERSTLMHDLLAGIYLDEGLRPPPECSWCGRPCSNCGRCADSGYCRFCGAYKGRLHFEESS